MNKISKERIEEDEEEDEEVFILKFGAFVQSCWHVQSSVDSFSVMH